MDPILYFPNTYEESKSRFLARTADCDLVTSLPILGDYAVDVAMYHTPRSDTLLLLTAGVHGIEGLLGSAIQQHFIESFLSHFAKRYSVALVHGINPWGMDHCRRANENNVDLNRSFIDSPSEYHTVTRYSEEILDEMAHIFAPDYPVRNATLARMRYLLGAAGAIARHGYPAMKSAIFSGQYKYDKGLFFGGGNRETPEKSVLAMRQCLPRITRGFKNVLHIDLHTGIGPRYGALFFCDHPVGSPEFNTVQLVAPDIFSNKTSAGQQKHLGTQVEVRGALTGYVPKHSAARNTFSFVLDFGTARSFTMLQHLVLENQSYQSAGTPPRARRKIQRDFIEAFYPSEEKWRLTTLKISSNIFDRVLTVFDLLSLQRSDPPHAAVEERLESDDPFVH